MRVFHFVNEEFGLENLRRRRLKIATLNELNDPFELFGVGFSDPKLRRAFGAMKSELSEKRGLLCFSKDWHNPVQWSHYGAKHAGLCLGFDIPDEHLAPVTYSRKRLVAKAEAFINPRELDIATATQFLFTKYAHWRYENEVRCFVTLEEKDPEKNLYFAEFSENLKLKTVIVGAQSSISRAQLAEAISNLDSNVKTCKARLAFNTFRVVTQRDVMQWK